VLLFAFLLSGLFPSAYMGGAGDDARYLEAMRCAAAQGYCAPTHHWAARLPVVLPSAFALWLFGESRSTLVLVPLVYAAGALTLLALVVRRVAGERAAIVAACALAATPVFINRAQRIGADMPELCFLLGGLWLLMLGVDRDRRWVVLAAGAAFGMAVLSRTSAIVAAPIVVAGLICFTRAPLQRVLLLGVGGASVLAAEALLHAIGAGNPLLSWELAHAHTRIPSSALPIGLDLSRSPILNADYIANWERERGIEVHWLLDGALNVIADPLVSITLIAAAAFCVSSLARSNDAQPRRRISTRSRFLLAVVASYFCLLTFVLAVHPTPRMFLPILCVAAFAIGLWADRNRTPSGQAVIAATLALMTASTALQGLNAVDLAPYEREAERWAGDSKGGLAIDPIAASVFTLSPTLSALPSGQTSSSVPVLTIGPACEPESGPPAGAAAGVRRHCGLGPARRARPKPRRRIAAPEDVHRRALNLSASRAASLPS
jgi:4-amino-4-deoxy-L-arabinose transferase-like glycosyltransferase